jgi:outer membrane immunogenic protein
MMKLSIAVVTIAALIGTPAVAADIAAGAPPPSPVWSWTGCYLGINGGGGRSKNEYLPLADSALGTARANGFFGGGQVGCDYQTARLVFGIEGAFDAGDLHGASLIADASGQVVSKIDMFATGTGRVGYAFGRALTYVKGGFAWAHFKDELDSLPDVTFLPDYVGSAGIIGWVIGGGLEVAIQPNWSFKVEYSYYDFGTNGVSLTCQSNSLCGAAGIAVPFDIKSSMQTVMIGVNYRFGIPMGQ